MASNSCIDKQAQVVEISPDFVFVTIEVAEACHSCSAKMVCGAPSDAEKRELKIKRDKKLDLQIGDKVIVSVKKSSGYKAVVLSYVLPFLVFFLTLIITSLFNVNELTTGLFALALVFVYFAVIVMLRKKIDNKINFSITKTN